jgi:hypothetical protein
MSRPSRLSVLLLLAAAGCCPPDKAKPATPVAVAPEIRDLAVPGEVHLKNVRQLTFGGDNAEAYWAFGGDRLIMQTNHKPYQCDQIEELSVHAPPAAPGVGGKLVSTGKGRTTCSYFLKGDQEIIYASTHESSPTCPTPPDMSKGYYWGLFDFDIYRANADGSNLRKLTSTPGYDAEATVCPKDGSIVFTSMRDGDLDLYRMDADGKNVVRLTHEIGYDGGAFFSPDCSKIVWRSSRPTGKDLEEYQALLKQNLVKPTKMDIFVANADGSDARQLTYNPGASFAPFFYPSGKRVMFASNYLNPKSAEFDLFAVNIDGTDFERITFGPSFDGFPMFSPDGKTLAFSSNRRDVIKRADGTEVYRLTGGVAGPHDTNVFLADWVEDPKPVAGAPESAAADRYMASVAYLADDAREGRDVGSAGLGAASDWVEAQLKGLGVEPGVAGSFRQPFEVTTKLERGAKTALTVDGKALDAAVFAPSQVAKSGTASGEVVAVGWGIREPAHAMDDFKGKQVKGKVVLVHRFVPPDAKLSPEDAAHLGDLRYKAFVARGLGAVGMIVVDDGDPKQDEAPLPALAPGADSDAGIPIVLVTRAGAAALVAKGAHKATLTVELTPVRAQTANVVGVIHAGAATKQPGVIVVGAHVDHLGMGGRDALDSVAAIHNGADDNASGVAGLIEVARALTAKKGELTRDVYLVAFSGEEKGLLGSAHYVKHMPTAEPVIAMLNMDMIGRMRMNQLAVNGVESAPEWKALAQPACDAQRVACTLSGNGYGPSDSMSFYVAGAPVLFFFTGSHLDYHTATDDADKINAIGGARVAAIVADIAVAVDNHQGPLTYTKAAAPMAPGGDVRRKGASLGTIPSYNDEPNQPPGAALSDVVPDGPAAKAGLKGGDRIVLLGTVEIRNLNDLMFVLQAAKPGEAVKVTVIRDGKRLVLEAVYGAPRGRR